DAGEAADEGRPAGDGADDDVRLDAAPVRLDAGDARAVVHDPGHGGVLVDLDARPVGRAREAPHDGVVADDPARRVVERAHDGPRRLVGEVELRTELPDLFRVYDARVD